MALYDLNSGDFGRSEYDPGNPPPFVPSPYPTPNPGPAAPNYGTNDPPVKSPEPTAATGWQIPTNPNGTQVGGTPNTNGWIWDGASSWKPPTDPAGYTWNPTYAAYQPSAATTTQTPAGGAGGRDRAAAYFASKGVTPFPTSLDTWDAYWNQWGKNDPAEFDRRLSMADEFTGVGQHYNGFASGGGGQTVPPGGSYTSTNPFSDPATKNYIDLLNSRVQQLLTPQQNPQMDSLLQYMQKYFQQLQQPTYTDAQRATIATQQLDPMERQRQQRKQQVLQTMASRGMGPTDGPTLSALAQVDREYDSMRASTQGQIANNELTLGRQNQTQAVDVGSALASLVSGMNNQQDTRANTAVNYAQQIPNLAQQRLGQAITLLNGNSINPAQLLTSLHGFQQQGLTQNSQDSQYYAQIISALAKAFGL